MNITCKKQSSDIFLVSRYECYISVAIVVMVTVLPAGFTESRFRFSFREMQKVESCLTSSKKVEGKVVFIHLLS